MIKKISPIKLGLVATMRSASQTLGTLVLSLAIFALSASNARAMPEKVEIKIGVIVPLTGSTDVYGAEARRMIELLNPSINSRSSKYRYKFIFEDGRCGAGNAAITAAQKLLEIDRVQFMLVGCSGEILQTAQVLNGKKVLTLSLFGSHPDVKKIGGYVFRTYPDADTGVRGLFQSIESRGFQKVAVITEEVSFTEGRRKLMESLLGERLIVNQTFKADDQDLKAIILKAKSAKPDVLYLNAASPLSHQSLLRQVRQMKFEGELVANEPAGDKGSVASLGSLQNGVIFISAAVSKPSTAAFAQVMKEYQERYHSSVEFPTIAHSSYNALEALTSVVEISGLDVDAVKKALVAWKGLGTTGELKFDGNQDLIGSAFELQVIRDGVPVSEPHLSPARKVPD